MSKFLDFLLASYAPLAARFQLVERVPAAPPPASGGQRARPRAPKPTRIHPLRARRVHRSDPFPA